MNLKNMKSEDTVAYVFEFLKLGGQEGVHESISGPFKKNYFASLFKYFSYSRIIFHLSLDPGFLIGTMKAALKYQFK